mmetsp:Transcript_17628/g.36516  ORF Transcript_17628/g.36516 Transcript_17628/m.36516 type:complete len:91 (-) Transcript_17628:95-367(-)
MQGDTGLIMGRCKDWKAPVGANKVVVIAAHKENSWYFETIIATDCTALLAFQKDIDGRYGIHKLLNLTKRCYRVGFAVNADVSCFFGMID